MINRFKRLCSLVLSTAIIGSSIFNTGLALTPVYADEIVEIADLTDDTYEIMEAKELEDVLTDNIEEVMSNNAASGNKTPDFTAFMNVDSESLSVDGQNFEVIFNVYASTAKSVFDSKLTVSFNDAPLTGAVVSVGDGTPYQLSFNKYPVKVKGTVSVNGVVKIYTQLKYLDVTKPDSEQIIFTSVPVIVDSTDISKDDFLKNTMDSDLGLAVTFGNKDIVAGLVESQGNYYYTGNAIKPSIKVYDGNVELVEGKDYKVKYKNNKTPVSSDSLSKDFGNGWVKNGFPDKFDPYFKQPQIQITGAGTYKGVKLVKFFNILPIDYDEDKYVYVKAKVDKALVDKSKKDIKPTATVTVYKNDKAQSVLKMGSKNDYILIYTPVEVKTLSDGSIEYIKQGEGDTKIKANKTGLFMLTVEPTLAGKKKITAVPHDVGVVTVVDKTKNIANATVEFKEKEYKFKDMGVAIVSDNSKIKKDDEKLERFAYWTLSSDEVTVYVNGSELLERDYNIFTEASAGKNKSVYITLTESGKQRYGYKGMEEGKACKVSSKLNVKGESVTDLDVSVMSTKGEIPANGNVVRIPYDGSFVTNVEDYAEKIVVRDGKTILSGNGYDYRVRVKKECKLPVGTTNIEIIGCDKYAGSLLYTFIVATNEPGAKKVSINEIFKVCQFGSTDDFVDFDNDSVATLDSVSFNKSLKPQINLVRIVEKTLKDGTHTTIYEPLTKSDFGVKITYKDKKTKIGEAKAVVTFKGTMKYIQNAEVVFEVLPQSSADKVWSSGVMFTNKSEEMSDEMFFKKASRGISLYDLDTGKKLANKKDYVITADDVYNEKGGLVTASEMDANTLYFIEITGRGSYEGLTKLIPASFSVKGKSAKIKTKEVVIAAKGDVSYMDKLEFIDEELLPEDISISDLEARPIANKGNYDIKTRKWKFDEDYYGKAGNKKVTLMVVSGEYAGQCLSASFKVKTKDKKVTKYNYIKSLFPAL